MHRKIKDLENTIEAATRLMSEKDKEITGLEEKLNLVKTQYGRMSTNSRMSATRPISMEGADGFPGCGNKNVCAIV